MISDLSKVHELISDLFEWPKNEKDWDQYRLTGEQIAFFHENGIPCCLIRYYPMITRSFG